MEKVNILDALASLDEHWSQKTIGEANGSFLKSLKASARPAGTSMTTRTNYLSSIRDISPSNCATGISSWVKTRCLLSLKESSTARPRQKKSSF